MFIDIAISAVSLIVGAVGHAVISKYLTAAEADVKSTVTTVETDAKVAATDASKL